MLLRIPILSTAKLILWRGCLKLLYAMETGLEKPGGFGMSLTRGERGIFLHLSIYCDCSWPPSACEVRRALNISHESLRVVTHWCVQVFMPWWFSSLSYRSQSSLIQQCLGNILLNWLINSKDGISIVEHWLHSYLSHYTIQCVDYIDLIGSSERAWLSF